MPLELRALRYFNAVAEFGNYSRAADFLCISQPAVSRQVQLLEAQLGKVLVIRHGHGVRLTEAGEVLWSRSQRIVRDVGKTEEEIKSGKFGPTSTVTLAVPPGAGTVLVPAVASLFNAQYPGAFLKIVSGYASYINEWLRRGHVDLACIHDPLLQRGFTATPLVEEEIFLVGKPEMFTGTAPKVRLGDLGQFPLILPSRPTTLRRLLDNWSAQEGIMHNLKMEVDDPSIILALVRAGHGFALESQEIIQPDVRNGTLLAKPFSPKVYWRLALVESKDGLSSDLTTSVAELVRKAASVLIKSGAWRGAR